MFVISGVLPQLHASEKAKDTRVGAVYVNTITLQGLANCSNTEDENEGGGLQPLA